MKRKFGYDDSLDVFGVHGVGGFLGTVMAGIFGAAILGGNQEGLAIGSQVGIQLFAATLTALWAGVASFVLFKVVDALVGLRVSEDDESVGLDVALHEESGYNL
jgi:Amt family ammonium transporter